MPNDWTEEDIFREVGAIASRFPLLHCYRCAIALKEWLIQHNIPGKIWRITTRYDEEDFILSDRLEQQGITESITENGVHYGVEVYGKIFDNLSEQGLVLEDWIKDFHSLSDEFEIAMIETF